MLPKILAELDPAAERWVAKQLDAKAAWADCPRGDWLLWYAGRVGVSPKLCALAASGVLGLVEHADAGEQAKALAVVAKVEEWAGDLALKGDVQVARVQVAKRPEPANIIAGAVDGQVPFAAVVTQVARLAAQQDPKADLDALLARAADEVRAVIDRAIVAAAEKG
jgi:hypothetical protein